MNMPRFTRASMAILAAGLLAACGGAATPPAAPRPAEVARVADKAAGAPTTIGASTGQSDVQPGDRLIIRNAVLTLVVKNTADQLKAITQAVEAANGYVASSNITKVDQGLRAEVSLRVPAERLDAVLDQVRKLAVEVRSERITGEDVTAEYVDLGSRLRNLEAAETQLRDILSKATKTEDVLSVFKQLTEVRGQIEQTKGRMQYLEKSAALATITLTLIPDALAQPVSVPGWRAEGVVKQALEALVITLQNLAGVAIWFTVYLVPILLVIVIPIVLVVLIARRIIVRRRQQRSA